MSDFSSAMRDFVRDALARLPDANLSEKEIDEASFAVHLCCEELAQNIVHYGLLGLKSEERRDIFNQGGLSDDSEESRRLREVIGREGVSDRQALLAVEVTKDSVIIWSHDGQGKFDLPKAIKAAEVTEENINIPSGRGLMLIGAYMPIIEMDRATGLVRLERALHSGK